MQVLAASKPPGGQELAAVEAYLNGLTTVVADFLQTASDGSVSGGKFFLKRPGKLRWQYDPPVPVLIVSNGNIISYQDLELNQVSRASADETLSAFLGRKVISFSAKDVEVTAFSSKSGLTKVSLQRPGHAEDGALTMIFEENPIRLKKMEIIDSTGKATTVSFHNVQQGLQLPDKLFYVDEVSRIEKKR
jgi:outer membrane lipoprotein-sorting protein